MSRNAKQTKTEIQTALAEGPALALKVDEVQEGKGMTAEQVAVMASLAGLGDGNLADQKKERHPDRKKVSAISSPVQTAHAIFDALKLASPTMARKDMINIAIEKGIAFYTARTQYQCWKVAREGGEASKGKVDARPALDMTAFAASLAKTA